MHMSSLLCILHAYSTASGGSLRGAGTPRPGAREEIEVQPPQEEQAYPEQQQEYYDAPEATGELTSGLTNQGRHPMHS